MRPLLRCVGLTGEPSDQAGFYRRTIADALRSGARDALVCGSVDTALPDLVDAASADHRLALTVIDRCPTATAVVDGFATRHNLSLAAETADILAWRTAARFDLVLSHSLFGSFAPAVRPGLMAKWFALLKPGGLAATVVRLRPKGEDTRFDPTAIPRLATEAARRYAALPPAGEPTVEGFRAAVLAHAADRNTNPVHSLDEVAGLFVTAGFEIVSLTSEQAAKRDGAVAGPAQPSGATFCLALARRP